MNFLEQLPNLQELISKTIEVLKTNQFAQGGFLVTFIMSIPRYIIPYFTKLYQRIKRLVIFSAHVEETDDLYFYLERWLSDNHTAKYRNVEAAISLDSRRGSYDIYTGEYISNSKSKVNYKQYEDTFYIREGLNILKVTKGRIKLDNASEKSNTFYNNYIITGLFAKKSIGNLLTKVLEVAKEAKKEFENTKVEIFVSDTFRGYWQRHKILDPKPLNSVIVEGKEELIKDIKIFTESKKWYTDRNLNYKRGYLFTGAAGTGKTSTILSIAKEFNKSVYFLNLNGLTDRYLMEMFSTISSNSILVIEDIDAAFSKRDSSGKEGTNIKFSFSTLLNCLDGILSIDNLIVIFTSNHPEKLDHALLRAGRMDYKMEFKKLNNEYLKLFFRNFYEDESIDWENSYGSTLTTSDIQDICIRNKDSWENSLEEILNKDKYYLENSLDENHIYTENEKKSEN